MKERPNYKIQRKEMRGQILIFLSANKIGDNGFKYIVDKEEKTGQVTKLDLPICLLSAISMINMRSANWSSLRSMNLWDNQIGDKGCKFIPRVHLPALQEIDLSKNQITSFGVSHISKAGWKRLNSIDLSGNQIGFESIQIITKSNWMQNCNKNEKSSLEIYLSYNELFVDQVYRTTLHSCPKDIYLSAVDSNQIAECYEAKLRSLLKQKKIYLESRW